MTTKRTNAEKAQRQADQMEKKSEGRPEVETSKKTVTKDVPKAV